MNKQDLRTTLPNYERYRDRQRSDSVVGIAIHHGGPGTVDESGFPALTPRELVKRRVRDEGQTHAAYHYAIDWDGTVFYLLDERIPGDHATLPEPDLSDHRARERWEHQWLNGEFFNQRYLAVLLMGWFDTDRWIGERPLPDQYITPSDKQLEALLTLVRELQQRYQVPIEHVEGHRELLERTGFGTTSCPGTQLDLQWLRHALQDPPKQTRETVVVPGPAPTLDVPANSPLVGLHARNDYSFTRTDWEIIRQARVESLKMMSFTDLEMYTEAREINPDLEFIVRLYIEALEPGHVPSPLQFADHFHDLIDQLYRTFGVLKFEIHNEPNHPDGLEGWGPGYEDAVSFQKWYIELFTILRQRHPWALFGYPGLAVPHNDLEWLEWNREAIELSDWLGMHCYWQTPEGLEDNFSSPTWGRRFEAYHEKYPHKLIEITEFGNSNGQTPPLVLTREEQRRQYVAWMEQILTVPYLGSAHGFIATSPDPRWEREGFTWGDETGPYPVAGAVGALARPLRRPDWHYLFDASVPFHLPPSANLTFPISLANSGRLPWRWSGPARTFVNAKWLDEEGRETGESTSVLLPHDVPPGGQAQLKMTVRAPNTAGIYQLRLALYHNGQSAWLHLLDPASQPFYFTVQVGLEEQLRPELAATCTPVLLPERALAGSLLPTVLRLRNEGTQSWPLDEDSGGSIRIGYSWINENGQATDGTEPCRMERTTAPGESTNITCHLPVPEAPGRHRLAIGIISEHNSWIDLVLDWQIEIDPADYGVSYDLPAVGEMAAGETRELPIRLLNSGGRTWEVTGGHPITVAHFWRNENDQDVQSTLRTLLPHNVPPGGSVTLTLPLAAPDAPGTYTLKVDLSKEGHFLFSEQGQLPHSQSINVRPAGSLPPWDALWLELRGPAPIVAGESGRVDVRLRNTGGRPWLSDTIRIAYQWDNGTPYLVKLPHDVAPGTEVALGLPILPIPAGTYSFNVDLWWEGEGWLGLEAPMQEVEVIAADPPRAVETPKEELLETAPMPALEHRVDERLIQAEQDGAFYPEIRRETRAYANNHLLPIPVRSAIASHNPERASLAIDGHTLTAWNTRGRQEPGMWFLLDLGKPHPVRRIRITSYKAQYPCGFRLEASLDGREWAPLEDRPDNHGDIELLLPIPHNARYLRITQTGETTDDPWSIRAISVERDNISNPNETE